MLAINLVFVILYLNLSNANPKQTNLHLCIYIYVSARHISQTHTSRAKAKGKEVPSRYHDPIINESARAAFNVSPAAMEKQGQGIHNHNSLLGKSTLTLGQST
jgi:hypothetical protein